VASRIVRSGCSSDSANSSSNDMDHQKYTHVIHAASHIFVGVPDNLAPTHTDGHWRTSTDAKGEIGCDQDHIEIACPDSPDTAVSRARNSLDSVRTTRYSPSCSSAPTYAGHRDELDRLRAIGDGDDAFGQH
jgi:hypothetical protein